MDDEDFQERFRALEREAAAEFQEQQTKKRAAEQAEQARALEAKKLQMAMVKARQQELATTDEDDDDEDEDKPGFLTRLFGKRMGARDALEIAGEARGELDKPRTKKEKSLLWSGGLSFFLGPVGWLYAGSFRESVPASVLYLGAAAILQKLPAFMMWPVMSIALPVSGLVGVAYAWRHNKKGKRVRLLSDKKNKKLTS